MFKAEIESLTWEEQSGLMEMALDGDALAKAVDDTLAKAVDDMREQHGRSTL